MSRITLYLGATALALVLGAPAFAQTVIYQNNGFGTLPDPSQSDINSAVIFAPGASVSSFASQQASTLYNGIGPTGYVAVGNPYSITQAAGTYDTITGPTAATVNSTAENYIGANNENYPGLAAVAAGGNQSAVNQVNLANFAPPAGSAGSLTQVVGAATLDATNRMFAVANNGTATVNGSAYDTNGNLVAGFQQAVGTLNTGGVYVTAPTAPATGDATDLTLTQKMTGNNSIQAINSAIANSQASGSALLDPTVTNINQGSQVGVNQLSFASSGAATVGLDGFQNGVPELLNPLTGNPIGTGTLTTTLGNTAVAYTGPNNNGTFPSIPNGPYNLFSNLVGPGVGNGAASISGVTQNASFGLNNVFGGADVSIALSQASNPLDGFTQSVTGTSQDLNGPTGPYGNVAPNVINGMVASAGTGSASVSGVALSSTNKTFTQSFLNQQNSISTGGNLSGTATQSASNFTPGGIFGLGYANVAGATVAVGSASVSNVSQDMGQSLNSVSSGSGLGLNLSQNAGGIDAPVNLASNNLQGASGSTSATVSGAVQRLNTSVNTATLTNGTTGGLSGTLNQTGTDVSLNNNNVLAANAISTVSISGTQIANSSLNVATLGAAGGTVTQTETGASLNNSNTVLANSGYNASSNVGQSASSQINVIQ